MINWNQNNMEALGLLCIPSRLKKDAKLSFGFRAGIYSQTINTKLYRFIDLDDPIFLRMREGMFSKPDLAAGLFFRKEKFYLGAGFQSATQSSLRMGPSQTITGLKRTPLRADTCTKLRPGEAFRGWS